MSFRAEYQEENGVLIFDSQIKNSQSIYDQQYLDKLFVSEPCHFWFSARRDKICQIFQQYVGENKRVLEIGCGTGYVAEKLVRLGFQIEVSDLYLKGLQYAKNRGLKKCYQFDLFKSPFHEEFDVILFCVNYLFRSATIIFAG